MFYTTKQVCDFLGISNTTLRAAWVPEFAGYLSEHATPPKGQERRFTPEDVAVLYTVAALRERAVEFPDIHTKLVAGERIEPEPGERPAPASDDSSQDTAVTVAAFSAALASYEARIDKLEDRLEEAQAARLLAEIRAARAETELSTLRALYTAEEGQGKQRTGFAAWWARRFGGRN